MRMFQRRGNKAEWASKNPILGEGELGVERDTKKLKIGDGVTPWNSLSYFSDVSPPLPPPFPQPSDQGFAAWSYDPAQAATTVTNALASGVVTLIKVRLTSPTTLSSLSTYISGAGVTLTAGQCFGGLYNSAGTLIAKTADQSTVWTSVGPKNMPLTAVSGQSLTLLPAGVYYLAFLAVGTTMPSFFRAAFSAVVNQGLTSGSYRFATYGSALTALPTSIAMANQIPSGVSTWAAVV